jgi:hypothetical protein
MCVNLTKGQIDDFKKIRALIKILFMSISAVQISPLAGYAYRYTVKILTL